MRDDLRDAGVDALVVTSLPNLRYLTGFNGTAGAAIVTAAQCVLVVDFRYQTDARQLLAARADSALTLEVASGGNDSNLVAVLEPTSGRRSGSRLQR